MNVTEDLLGTICAILLRGGEQWVIFYGVEWIFDGRDMFFAMCSNSMSSIHVQIGIQWTWSFISYVQAKYSNEVRINFG